MLKVQASQCILPKESTEGDDACAYTIIDNTLLVAVLCDGVGSALRGGHAARQAVKFFIDQFHNRPKAWEIPKTMEVFTRHINALLFRESMSEYNSIELVTTLALAVVEGETLYTLTVGDSRIYLQKNQGELKQLSTDDVVDDPHLSHVLTKACGMSENIHVEVRATKLAPKDTLFLCSDGLYNVMNITEIQTHITAGLAATALVQNAAKSVHPNARDDISAQLFCFETLDPLHALKSDKLPIPLQLHEGQILDGYLLVAPLMEHKRIWKVKKDATFFVMKFPMNQEDEALDVFIKEAWFAKQINHDAFPKAWIPKERSVRYYMMELIEGVNLKEYLKRQTLSVDDAITLGKFLYEAQLHLLQLGLVHGDIKPENILVYTRGLEAGIDYKMVDFGSIVEIFSTNSRAGTSTYLAPERFHQSAINESTELFAMGVTLYWALTGKFPYGEIEPFQTPRFKHAKPPSSFNKNIPPWLDALLLRTIAIDPKERYKHYSEFWFQMSHPSHVKPFFAKDTPLIERNPLMFYKVGFIIMLLLEAITLLRCASTS